MKRISVVMFLMLAVLTANCQKKDQTFDVTVRFNEGIQFGDGTIQATAATGVGVVTWDAIIDKPTAFMPIPHTHNTLYKPLDYVPLWNEVLDKPVFSAVATTGSFNDLADVPEFIQIEEALPLLRGIRLPVLTQTEIDALTPVKGLLLFNDNAKAGSWKNLSTDTLVVTNLWGVIETGSGTSTIAVQVSWSDTLNAVVPTNLNSSAYTVTSTTVGNSDTSFANTKIPPNAIVKGVISGVSAGNRPKYLQFQITGYRIPTY